MSRVFIFDGCGRIALVFLQVAPKYLCGYYASKQIEQFVLRILNLTIKVSAPRKIDVSM